MKVRESNIELLRILAIFLVLVVHADFWTIGDPEAADFEKAFVPSVTRVFLESLSIVCVNVFVIISGWYGIKASIRKLSCLSFQGFFFLIIPFIIAPYLGFSRCGLPGLVNVFFPGWFLKAYAVLLIVSPLLNNFVENSSEKRLRNVLIAFFLFELVYGWLTTSVPVYDTSNPLPTLFIGGYSATSLIGLYMLARYVRLHLYDKQESVFAKKLNLSNIGGNIWLTLWFLIVVGDTAIWCVSKYYGLRFHALLLTYTNPIVIFQSLAMFMTFKHVKLNSRFVNWAASSALSVYMLHSVFSSVPYRRVVLFLYEKYSGISCLLFMFAFLLAVAIISILLDQIRKFIWGRIEPVIPDYKL